MSGFISTTTMMVLGAALLAAAVPEPENVKVHEQMTAEEVRQVFQSEPDAVPKYEVVPISWPSLHKRAAGTPTRIQLNAFGSRIGLWLKPIDGILAGYDTPVYYAKSDRKAADGVRFVKIDDPMTVVGRMLEDKEKKATLVVKQAANGKKLVSGMVGSENWIIRPLPPRFAYPRFNRRQRSADDYNVDNATIAGYDEPHHHVIYKIPVEPEGTKYVSLPMDADLLDSESSRSKRATNLPSTMYPQLLVVVDYASYQRHNGDTYALLEYLLPFWNAVDLRYRGLEYPKIRLNIAGIIIEADPHTLPYIRKNKVTVDRLDVVTALGGSGDFRRNIESTFPLDNYDIMVTMVPYDMCDLKEPGCPIGTLGLAYVTGACKNYLLSSGPKSQSVTIIRDRAGFDGVHPAAHELGHLFGAGHDDGSPEAPCTVEAGHIMAASPQLSENSGDWSPCTLSQFDTFFRGNDVVCLFNKPQSRSPMARVLPGRLQTMDDQCMKIEGTKSCNKDQRFPPSVLAQFAKEICMKLRCYDEKGRYCKTMNTAPADGAICDEGMMCLHTKCIRETDITY